LIETRAAEWLAQRDSGAWDSALQHELDAWLNQATAHRIAYLRLQSTWQRADALAGLSTGAQVPVQESVPHALDDASEPHALPRFSQWRIAAGVMLACALGLLLALPRGGSETQLYATAIGENRTIGLNDGTRLTLNTNTRLRTAARQVWLESGEAYFDVAHDSAHPFVIEAGTTRITVLGTRFSVRRDHDRTRVLVAEGKVRVTQAGNEAVLTPNSAATASQGRITLQQQAAERTDSQLSWREGRLVLDQMTLGQAAEEFNRYNRRKLVIADASAARMSIGGSFSPSNIDGFARLLEQGFGLRATATPDQITISR
jgi:transmembrane sensor